MSQEKTYSTATIPAQPGFYLLDLLGDGSVSRAAIVAWFIEYEGLSFVNPITVHGFRAGHMCAILHPDGETIGHSARRGGRTSTHGQLTCVTNCRKRMYEPTGAVIFGIWLGNANSQYVLAREATDGVHDSRQIESGTPSQRDEEKGRPLPLRGGLIERI